MIPFRPAESPVPWMYIANGSDYQSFSAPGAADAVTQQKVGIAEPQSAPDASISSVQVSCVNEPAGGTTWTAAGTAGAVSLGARISDTVAAVFPDPLGLVNTLQVGASGANPGGVAYLAGAAAGNSTAPAVSFSAGGGSSAAAYAQMAAYGESPRGPLLHRSFCGGHHFGSGYSSAPGRICTGGGR